MNATDYPIHPLCLTSTDMSEADFQKLRASIEKTEQSVSIKRYRGLIIDGRHRLKACLELGVTPWIEEFASDIDLSDEDLREIIAAWNDERRHETPAQRVESQLRLLGKAETAGEPLPQQPANKPLPGRSNKDIAKAAGVSGKTVKRVKAVKKKGIPEVQKAMIAGSLSVEEAARIAKLSKKEQKKLAKDGAKALKAAAKSLNPKTPKTETEASHAAPQADTFQSFKNRVLSELALLSNRRKPMWNTPPPPTPTQIMDEVTATIRGMV